MDVRGRKFDSNVDEVDSGAKEIVLASGVKVSGDEPHLLEANRRPTQLQFF